MRSLVICLVVAILAAASFAVAQTAGEPNLTDSQRAARLRAWGNGPEVRFAPKLAAQVFQQTSEQFAAVWPTQGRGDGVLDGARVRHPRLATSFPLESDPCRLVWFKQFDEGVGGFAIYVCRPDQPLAYATISFEAVAPGQERHAIELAAAEQRDLAFGPPVCEPVTPSPGFAQQSFCQSRFTQTGAAPDAGRVLVVAGERPGYFFKVQTACIGAQCSGARPAFEALIASLTFAP